jgi:hypothetical protein
MVVRVAVETATPVADIPIRYPLVKVSYGSRYVGRQVTEIR